MIDPCGNETKFLTMSCIGCSFKSFIPPVQVHMHSALKLKDHREDNQKFLKSQLKAQHLYSHSSEYFVVFQ